MHPTAEQPFGSNAAMCPPGPSLVPGLAAPLCVLQSTSPFRGACRCFLLPVSSGLWADARFFSLSELSAWASEDRSVAFHMHGHITPSSHPTRLPGCK